MQHLQSNSKLSSKCHHTHTHTDQPGLMIQIKYLPARAIRPPEENQSWTQPIQYKWIPIHFSHCPHNCTERTLTTTQNIPFYAILISSIVHCHILHITLLLFSFFKYRPILLGYIFKPSIGQPTHHCYRMSRNSYYEWMWSHYSETKRKKLQGSH